MCQSECAVKCTSVQLSWMPYKMEELKTQELNLKARILGDYESSIKKESIPYSKGKGYFLFMENAREAICIFK